MLRAYDLEPEISNGREWWLDGYVPPTHDDYADMQSETLLTAVLTADRETQARIAEALDTLFNRVEENL